MPRYLDTRGNTKIAIGICGRCSEKLPYTELLPDPNYPGLYVCKDDLDQLDPYRLPARQTEDITLDHPRPDVTITGEQPTPLFGTNVIDPVVNNAQVLAEPIRALNPMRTWQPNTWYQKGDTVTPENIDSESVTLPQRWFLCLQDGLSGATPPDWPELTGVIFREPE